MQLLVTRPQPQADAWVAQLRERGVQACALPLMAIEPPGDASPSAQAWRDLARQRLVMFVSPNAVDRFFSARPADGAWPVGTRAGSTGPGTTDALRRQGLTPDGIVEPDRAAGRFDSEALWSRLRGDDWRGANVLVVRGEGGRDWLADTLRAAGAHVAFVEAYRRAVPMLDDGQQALLAQAQAHPDQQAWLFSSSQAVGHLAELAPAGRWAQALALATHPRVAEAAQAAGFGQVLTVSPQLDDIVAAWARVLQSPPP